MVERVLVLGTTGVDKDYALDNLKGYREDQYGEAGFEHINLEDDFILKKNRIKIFDYLDADEDEQVKYWLKGWNELKNILKNYKDKNLLLSMHSVLVHRSYGTRSPIKVKNIVEDFEPTMIVTFIDDVYIKWHRTQKRAGRQEYIGKPTLEQLLQGRRSEILIGDLLAKQTTEDSYPPHYVISVWHPARVLDRIIFRRPLATAYMSFPISKPRKLKSAGDISGEEEINGVLKRVSEFESHNHDIAFFCPLTIDEYPLLNAPRIDKNGNLVAKLEDKVKYFRAFQMNNRWNVRDFYGNATTLLSNDRELPKAINVEFIGKDDEVSNVKGMIRTDVGIRDYRMIRQSDFLVVINPFFKTVGGEFKFAKGVRNEIEYAQKLKRGVPIIIYQNPAHDPDGLIFEHLERGSGHVGGASYGSEYISIYNDLETFLNNIEVTTKKMRK